MSCRAASRVRIIRDVPVAQAQTAEMFRIARIVGRRSKVGTSHEELVLYDADEVYEFGDSFGLDFTICWDDRWILKGHNEHLSFWVDGNRYPPMSCCVLDHGSVVNAYSASDPKSGLIIDYLFKLLEAEAPAVVSVPSSAPLPSAQSGLGPLSADLLMRLATLSNGPPQPSILFKEASDVVDGERAHSRRTFLGPRGPLARSSKNLQKQFCAAAETADEVDEEAASYALVRALRAFQRRRTAARAWWRAELTSLHARRVRRSERAAREAWQEASRRVVRQLVAKGPFRSRLSNESFLSAFEERLEEKRPWCYPCLGRRRLETGPRRTEPSLLSLLTGAGLALLSPAERKALHRRKSEAGMNRLTEAVRAAAHDTWLGREAQARYEAVLARHHAAHASEKHARRVWERARRTRRRRV